jgi:hypothetical protein
MGQQSAEFVFLPPGKATTMHIRLPATPQESGFVSGSAVTRWKNRLRLSSNRAAAASLVAAFHGTF